MRGLGFTPSACQTCEQTRARVRLDTQWLPLSRMSWWRLGRQSGGDCYTSLTDHALELHLRSHFVHPTLKCGCLLPSATLAHRPVQGCSCRGTTSLLRPLPGADEIDAIGTKRYESQSGGEREIQRTMLELLNQMDGFDAMGDVKASSPCPVAGCAARHGRVHGLPAVASACS